VWPTGQIALGLLLIPLIRLRRPRLRQNRTRWSLLPAAILATVAIAGINGCGGGSTISPLPPASTAYTITVHITTGTLTQTTTVTLNVNSRNLPRPTGTPEFPLYLPIDLSSKKV
jgi:hypothetical protein